MKWDLKKMESKLFNLSNESKKQDKKMKETIKRIADKDDTKQSYDFPIQS